MASDGPGPKRIRARMTKISPIEITEEIFGRRTFTVATKIDVIASDSHAFGYRAGAIKHKMLRGTATTYTEAI